METIVLSNAKEVFEGLKMFLNYIGLLFLFILAITWAYAQTPWGRDDTDPGQGWFDDRSNMKVFTDAKTGCQYLGLSNGGLTPRLDETGKPVCVGPK
jgi:hypothetical protein